jgi:hypothetical protein
MPGVYFAEILGFATEFGWSTNPFSGLGFLKLGERRS